MAMTKSVVFTPRQAQSLHEGVDELMAFLAPVDDDPDQEYWDGVARAVDVAATKIPADGGTVALTGEDLEALYEVVLRLEAGLDDDADDFPSDPVAAREVLGVLQAATR